MKKYIIALVILVLVLVAGYFYWQQNKSAITDPGQVACTMEAKICPDGVTYVGRQGPKCEFEKCPGSIQSDQTDSSAVATCKGGDQVKCHPGTSTDNFTYINQDNPANWPTYKNDKYGYQVKYNGNAKISEVQLNEFSMSPEEEKAGETFEGLYKKYTGKICITIKDGYGSVTISAPENYDARVMCLRSGVGYNIERQPEKYVKVSGKSYKLSSFKEIDNVGKLVSETGNVILDDKTQIQYNIYKNDIRLDSNSSEYKKLQEELLTIIGTYSKI